MIYKRAPKIPAGKFRVFHSAEKTAGFSPANAVTFQNSVELSHILLIVDLLCSVSRYGYVVSFAAIDEFRKKVRGSRMNIAVICDFLGEESSSLPSIAAMNLNHPAKAKGHQGAGGKPVPAGRGQGTMWFRPGI